MLDPTRIAPASCFLTLLHIRHCGTQNRYFSAGYCVKQYGVQHGALLEVCVSATVPATKLPPIVRRHVNAQNGWKATSTNAPRLYPRVKRQPLAGFGTATNPSYAHFFRRRIKPTDSISPSKSSSSSQPNPTRCYISPTTYYAPRAETEAAVVIAVHSLASLNKQMQSAYSPLLARAHGRVTLHAVALGGDSLTDVTHLAPFVLRTASSRCFDGLASIASEGPELVVRRLITATAGEHDHFC
ncbi:hypothetical protein FB45DRAFT_1037182 [Roridomyces roridus]|uniref:Uncharacterized protein n=1 Tax=Roridomyces roridus TaxID=1738132 RepID=A0AAD7B6R4_9AGAR|nr:hypothetical protein FB45DRAFT_1037182 [Roridomyces roridus]